MNIWGIGHLFDSALDFLNQQKPDIINFQEVWDGKKDNLPSGFRGLELLREKLDLPHFFFTPNVTDNRQEGRFLIGNAIFSRWPIVQSETTFLEDKHPFNNDYLDRRENYPYVPKSLQRATIKTEDKVLNVFNFHGIWGKDGQDTDRRLEASRKIVEQIKERENVILSGDFNVNEGTKSISMIGDYLNNVFKDDQRKNSFNLRIKGFDSGYAKAVVDFVFVSRNIQVLTHQMPDLDVSDHLPLICELEV